MIVPGFYKLNRYIGPQFSHQSALIQTDARGRVLRRKTDRQHLLYASYGHLTHRIRNERLPIAHAHVNRQAQLFLHGLRLRHGKLGKRGFADSHITVANLFHHHLWNQPSPGDVPHEFWNVRGRVGTAMSKKQNGSSLLTHCTAPVAESLALSSLTKSTRARTFSTGVSGRIPCPRLKMCPARPPAWRRIASARERISF